MFVKGQSISSIFNILSFENYKNLKYELMQKKSKKISFKGQNIYIGIDVHLKNWVVTIVSEHTDHKSKSINPEAAELKKYLERNFPEGTYLSAYEAGFTGFSTHYDLIANGIKNIVVNPADIPTTDKERKQKEDKRDSRKIAKSLRSGDLQGIYVPSKETLEIRSMVRCRKTIVKDICRNKIRIKSFLNLHGIKIPLEMQPASKYWSARFTAWLLTIRFSTEYAKKSLSEIISATEHYRKSLLRINKELRAVSKSDKYKDEVNLLYSIPGVGFITAMTLFSEIEEFSRFRNLDAACSFVGLVPTTNSSGEKDRAGKITPRSNRPMRTVIIEAAWVAARIDPVLMLKYNELRKRMEPNDAIVRIAKKLLSRILFVMKNKKAYELSVIE